MVVPYPQTVYVGLVVIFQAEWQYVSLCVPGMAELLKPLKTALAVSFVPALLELDDPAALNFRRLLSHGERRVAWASTTPV